MNNKNKKINNYWYPEEIRPHIIKYLKDIFPDSIIRQESNFVDIIVLKNDGCIPVEIQRTYTDARYGNPQLKEFENRIRNQIEQNIDISGECWLFLDAKFLEYLKSASAGYISLNLKWLDVYYKEKKAKLFSITREGFIKELGNEDISVLTKFRISELDKNRHNIEYSVLRRKGFSTDEINDLYVKYKDASKSESVKFDVWLTREDSSSREKEYGYICQTLGHLDYINTALNCELVKSEKITSYLSIIGLIRRHGGETNDKFARIIFTDESDIARYFDGYIKNKELWNYLKTHPIDTKTFHTVIRGEYPNFLKDRMNQTDVDNAWKNN